MLCHRLDRAQLVRGTPRANPNQKAHHRKNQCQAADENFVWIHGSSFSCRPLQNNAMNGIFVANLNQSARRSSRVQHISMPTKLTRRCELTGTEAGTRHKCRSTGRFSAAAQADSVQLHRPIQIYSLRCTRIGGYRYGCVRRCSAHAT